MKSIFSLAELVLQFRKNRNGTPREEPRVMELGRLTIPCENDDQGRLGFLTVSRHEGEPIHLFLHQDHLTLEDRQSGVAIRIDASGVALQYGEPERRSFVSLNEEGADRELSLIRHEDDQQPLSLEFGPESGRRLLKLQGSHNSEELSLLTGPDDHRRLTYVSGPPDEEEVTIVSETRCERHIHLTGVGDAEELLVTSGPKKCRQFVSFAGNDESEDIDFWDEDMTVDVQEGGEQGGVALS